MKANMGYSDTDPTPNPSPSWEGSGYRILLGSWGRFSDHFFDKKELNDVAIFK